MPDVAEQDETGPPGEDLVDDVFASEDNKVENKAHQREETAAEKSEEISAVPVDETKSPADNMSEETSATMKQEPGKSAVTDATKTEEDGEIPSAVKEDKLNGDIFTIRAKEELDKKEETIKSSWDSLNMDRFDRSVSDINGNLITVNGVHEDLSPTETPEKVQVDSKPELVTVKESYSLAAAKQKVAFAEKGSHDTEIDGTFSLSSENYTGQHENSYKQQQLPAEVQTKGRDVETRKLNDREKTETSSTSATQVDDSNNKLKTSLKSSDIPLAFDRQEVRNDPKFIPPKVLQEHELENTGKISAGRPQVLQNTEVTEKGGKTDLANQSQSIKTPREVEDDSPWVLQLPQGGELASRKISDQKRKNISNRRTERKQENKQSAVKDKKALVLPTLTINQSDGLNVDRNREHSEELSKSDKEHTKRVETTRPRRTSESDLNTLSSLSPLSPLMEDQESNSTFLHPPGAQGTKVRKNKSFMARGFSKMFGSKRKYKLDKEQKDTSYSSESDNIMAREEFDLRVNHNTEKTEKKKKKKERNEKKSDELSTDENGADKKSSRKFGGLFSRGKKKEKHSNHNERK